MIADTRSPAQLLDEARRMLDLDVRTEAEAEAIHLRAIALALIAIAERVGR